jgi:hypothetical protein
MGSPIVGIDSIVFSHGGGYVSPWMFAEIDAQLLDGKTKKFLLGGGGPYSVGVDPEELQIVILEWMKKRKKFGPVDLNY